MSDPRIFWATNPVGDGSIYTKYFVQKVHEHPTKLVLALTGGGSQAIGELLRYGNGSQTLLDARVPYDSEALYQFIGYDPSQCCSKRTAKDLAMAAHCKASVYTHDNVIGVGSTSSLVKPEGEREGREHKIFAALHDGVNTRHHSLVLGPGYCREVEETINAAMILNIIGEYCGVGELKLPLVEGEKVIKEISDEC